MNPVDDLPDEDAWLTQLTDEQICERLPNRYPPTVKSCRSRLSNRGLLVPAGVRKNSRGHRMTVWALATGVRP